MLAYLKIKVVSLAAESKLIRRDELKHLKFARNARALAAGEEDQYTKYAAYHHAIFFGLQYIVNLMSAMNLEHLILPMDS